MRARLLEWLSCWLPYIGDSFDGWLVKAGRSLEDKRYKLECRLDRWAQRYEKDGDLP